MAVKNALEPQLAYWKQQLSAPLPVLQLPTDRPRPSVPTFIGEQQFWTLSQSLTDELDALSRREGVTLYMTLLAAFKVLLYRYTGQEDILVGSPLGDRQGTTAQGERSVLANTLALRTDLAGNPRFQTILERVQETVLGADAHRDIPFDSLVADLQLEQDLRHTPIFQVLFRLHNTPTLSPLPLDNEVEQFDLTLCLENGPTGWVGALIYNADLFDRATIGRMVGHWQTLLEGIIANPAQRLLDLPLLMAAERQQLAVWNNAQANSSEDISIHRLFEAQVERTPDAVALIFEDEQLTYRALNQRANQLAHALQTLGVGPESLVGICMERSLALGIGVLGILKAGGACVPLEPTDPDDHLAFMLEDTQLSILLTHQQLLDEKPCLQPMAHRLVRLVCLDTAWADIALEETKNPISGTTAKNLAYVAYTSGSTGKPKGVLVSHRELCSRQLWLQETFNLTATDRFLMNVYRGLIIHYALLAPLLFGGQVIVARPGGHRDIAYLVRLIAERRITGVYVVPSMLPFFLKEASLKTCDCIRQVFCGSEALPTEFQAHFFSRLAHTDLHNLYGATEATFSTSWHCQRESRQGLVPIGRPATHTQIYLLDAHLQPVPIGIPGELYIGGANLARGYLNRSELTAERFIPNPHPLGVPQGDRNALGTRLYKTGDLARYLPDGNIEYIGRIDRQVKVRGLRIELGEIEAALNQHPAVRQVAVLAREDRPGDKRLVAYVVLSDRTVTPQVLRHFLNQKLPHYMVPSAFMVLDALPLMPSGKLNRHALPAPNDSRPEIAAPFVAPRTPIEAMLANIWTEVLAVDPVGVDDNFLDLGGHSLLATQVMSRVGKVFQVELSLRSFFAAPTVAELAEAIIANEAKPGQAEKIARTIQRLKSMSRGDVQQTLQGKKG